MEIKGQFYQCFMHSNWASTYKVCKNIFCDIRFTIHFWHIPFDSQLKSMFQKIWNAYVHLKNEVQKLLLKYKLNDRNIACTKADKVWWNWPNFFLCKRIIFQFFAVKLGHFRDNSIVFICYKHSKIRKQRKTKLCRIDSKCRKRKLKSFNRLSIRQKSVVKHLWVKQRLDSENDLEWNLPLFLYFALIKFIWSTFWSFFGALNFERGRKINLELGCKNRKHWQIHELF